MDKIGKKKKKNLGSIGRKVQRNLRINALHNKHVQAGVWTQKQKAHTVLLFDTVAWVIKNWTDILVSYAHDFKSVHTFGMLLSKNYIHYYFFFQMP